VVVRGAWVGPTAHAPPPTTLPSNIPELEYQQKRLIKPKFFTTSPCTAPLTKGAFCVILFRCS
jgi:hypothetical protein